MPPKVNRSHGVICSEAIALLYLLHPVPAPPSRNLLTDHGGHAQGYKLRLSEEHILVENLAFLSNIEHNVDRIPAICIYEVPESSSLNVLLAVNRTGADDGKQYLQRVKEGFETIFVLLAKPRHDHSRHEMQDKVLAAIVQMCSKRILHRLRLVAGRGKKPKQPIQAVLRTAIQGLKQVGHPCLGRYLPLSIIFTEHAKKVIRYAEAWTHHQTVSRLQDLVKAIHALKGTGDIGAMLVTLPNQALDPSMRKNIVNILNKVARYCDVSRLLFRMSKKHELIRGMKLVEVELPQSAWARPRDEIGNRNLALAFSQVARDSQRMNIAQVLHTLNITQAEANERFIAQTRKTLSEAKIHAEIQLVYYCELNPTRHPPRIIASSKDACYLCNAFISMHGKMHTSRTHGRLYPGWRLPVIPSLSKLEKLFIDMLERRIWESMATSLSRRRKTIHPEPNESTLLSLIHSESTDIGMVGERVEELNDIAGLFASGSEDRQEECANTQQDEADKDTDLYGKSGLQSAHSSALSQHNLTPQLEHRDEILIQGHKIAVRHDKTVHIAGRLELHVQPPKRWSSENSPRPFRYSLEWVASNNANHDAGPGHAPIIDLEQLQQEETFELDDECGLFVRARGLIVQINRFGKKNS